MGAARRVDMITPIDKYAAKSNTQKNVHFQYRGEF